MEHVRAPCVNRHNAAPGRCPPRGRGVRPGGSARPATGGGGWSPQVSRHVRPQGVPSATRPWTPCVVAPSPRGRAAAEVRGGLGSGRRGNRRCSETGILPATITAHPPVSHKVFHRRGRPAAKAPDSGPGPFSFYRATAYVRRSAPRKRRTPDRGLHPPRSPVSRTRRAVPPSPVGGTTRRGIVPIYTRGRREGPRKRTHVSQSCLTRWM